MSADRLRAAATRLREVAEAATPGPWEFENAPNGSAPLVHGAGMAVAETFDKPHLADATYIATMAPPVALAMADWLGKYANLLDRARHVNRPAYGDLEHALTLADAILGTDA